MFRFRKWIPLLLLTGLMLAYWPPQLTAQAPNQAAVVVRLGDNNVQTACVQFSEAEITGYDLLLRSGLDVAVDVQGVGALVCSIDGVGCPADDCLCQCKGGGNCEYWSYWHRLGGSWQYSQAGASIYPVTNGMVDGWSWGPGAVNSAIAPPNIQFEDVCQVAATETPTPEPEPTATAVPPTNTPMPSPTPLPDPEISFAVDTDTIQAGSCTTLRWRMANITAVYLNEIGVIGEDAQTVCPQQTETYTMRIVHAGGEETRTVTVNVLIPSATPLPTLAPLPTATPVPQQIVAAATEPATAVPSPTNTPMAVNTPDAASPTPLPVDNVAVAAVPTATTEIVWITAPMLPAETAVPATVAAALPAAPAGGVTVTPMIAAVSGDDTAVSWTPYTIFLLIMLMLGTLIWRANRQTKLS